MTDNRSRPRDPSPAIMQSPAEDQVLTGPHVGKSAYCIERAAAAEHGRRRHHPVTGRKNTGFEVFELEQVPHQAHGIPPTGQQRRGNTSARRCLCLLEERARPARFQATIGIDEQKIFGLSGIAGPQIAGGSSADSRIDRNDRYIRETLGNRALRGIVRRRAHDDHTVDGVSVVVHQRRESSR